MTITTLQVGQLLPDFTVQTTTGQTIHRRDYKGRQHLVVCFAGADLAEAARLGAAIAAAYPQWQAERGAALFITAAAAALPALPFPCCIDPTGELGRRFGVGTQPAFFLADRYGELVVATTTSPLPVAEATEILSLLEMCCSL